MHTCGEEHPRQGGGKPKDPEVGCAGSIQRAAKRPVRLESREQGRGGKR